MLMMCWFYCIPLARGLFFALPLLMLLFALFMLKRGIRQSRRGLRQGAFVLMFAAVLKVFILDIYFLRDQLPCPGEGWLSFACGDLGFRSLQLAGAALAAAGGFLLFRLSRRFVAERRNPEQTPEQVHMRFWANLSILLVALLIVWLVAPWLGYLTVGRVPALFMQFPWQHLAVLNILVLLVGFWRLEDCGWVYNPADGRARRAQVVRVWTPKDTLWLSVILFLIALAFSYASNDALSNATPHKSSRWHFSLEDLGLGTDGFEVPR